MHEGSCPLMNYNTQQGLYSDPGCSLLGPIYRIYIRLRIYPWVGKIPVQKRGQKMVQLYNFTKKVLKYNVRRKFVF